MKRFSRKRYEVVFLSWPEPSVRMSYVSAVPIPGITSSFVTIFTSLLPATSWLFHAAALPLQDWKHFSASCRRASCRPPLRS